MAPRKPAPKAKPAAKSKAAKPAPKVAAKAAPAAASKAPVTAKAANMGCVCACHSPIDPKKYGCWCNCHLFALLCQKGTLATWLLASALFIASGQGLALAMGAEAGMGADLLMSVLLGLPFALLYRLAYTGCGGLVEGFKLGLLIMAPLAIMLGGMHYSMGGPLADASITAGINLLQGGVVGAFCAWLLKPRNGMACCN